MYELTAFQRDVLYVVASLGDPAGVDIKRELEGYYPGDVSDSRLYKNLSSLVEGGLLEKGAKNERTNEYRLSERGRTTLVRHDEWKTRLASDVTRRRPSDPPAHDGE